VGASTYREFAPPPTLAPWVECFWTSHGGRAEFDVLPDGCVDFVFGAAAPGDGVLAGAMTRPLRVAANTSADVCAVRFRPGGAHPFVGADLREFTDRTVELDAIARDLGQLRRTVWQRDQPVERLAALRAWLLRAMPAQPADLLSAVHALVDAPSRFRVQTAARAIALSRQEFSRRVASATGLTPKLLARVLRVRSAVSAMGTASLASLAHDHGFSDQAHMARELRDITGRAATDLLRDGAYHSFKTDKATGGRLRT
jgi:AraC-like DNA-binding protein